MNLDFYLFNVNHGQSAAIRLPNGRWCIFDVGRSSDFSPVQWITSYEYILRSLKLPVAFSFLKATVSHLHGDHIADYSNLFAYSPNYFKTVDYDQEYLHDVIETGAHDSLSSLLDFSAIHSSTFGPALALPNYGVANISELSLPVSVARQISSTANSRVNNASVVTRINCFGNSILLCGDMEHEAWEYVLNNQPYALRWRLHVSNVDILVAPHHGHSSGYSTSLMNIARPSVVLVSVAERDPSVESRYSSDAVSGIMIGNRQYRCITTRTSGHIHISISQPNFPLCKGLRTWNFF